MKNILHAWLLNFYQNLMEFCTFIGTILQRRTLRLQEVKNLPKVHDWQVVEPAFNPMKSHHRLWLNKKEKENLQKCFSNLLVTLLLQRHEEYPRGE